MAATKVLKYVIYDLLRSRMVLAYAVLLFILSFALFYLESDPQKSILSLLNILMLLVPLVSIIFGTIHFYNSREFIEMLLAQPISRHSIFFAQYLGLAISLSLAVLFGAGIPALLFGFSMNTLLLLRICIWLTFIFTGIAMLSAVITNDKAKGIGISLLLWFYFSILFDGIVLLILFYFSDYPMEKTTMILSALNPIDLARIVMLMRLDVSALMGFTGAVFQKFFGSNLGMYVGSAVLLLWVVTPVTFAVKIFKRKDL